MPVGAISSNDPRAIVDAGVRAAESGQHTVSLPPAPPPPPPAPSAPPPAPSAPPPGPINQSGGPGGTYPSNAPVGEPGHPIGPVLDPIGSGSESGVSIIKPSDGPIGQAMAQELGAPKPGQITPTAAGANAVLDNSSYSSGNNLNIWNGVTGIDPGNNETGMKQELNRPIAAAQELSANWKNWGLDKNISFSNPPSSLPPQAQAVMKYVAANPALATELGYAGSTGKSTDITKAKVDAFIKQATSDAGSASDKVQDWMKKNPGASDQTKALVQSAAVVMANSALATSSDMGHQNGTTGNDGLMTSGGLSQLGAQNPGLSQTLGDAAKLWSQPGMFKELDTGGFDPSFNQPDGKVNTKNIGDWITKQAPTSDADYANMLNQAAVENTVAGIDTSKIGNDVFTDPSKYTGAQKAAVMVQLGDLSSKLQASVSDGIYNSGQNAGNVGDSGINSNPQAVLSDIAQKIQTLQQDPDVQGYLGQTLPGAQQAIMNSDGRVQTASQNFFNSSIQTGGALNDDLAQKDGSGNTVTPSTALQSFTQQTTFYDGALGTGGKTMGLLDPSSNGGPSQLNTFVKASGQEGSLESYYTNNIQNTQLLTNAVNSGTDIATATNQFSTAAAAFATALDPTFIANNAQQTQTNFVDNSTGAILNNASIAEINNAFGDQGGNEAQTQAIVQQLQKSDPSLFTASDGSAIPPDKVVNLVKQTTDLVRQGVKVEDAMSKVMSQVAAPTDAVAQVYKTGALHVLSAVIGGGVLAAKGVEGTASPTAQASVAATAAQALGTFTEGSGKYGGMVAKDIFSGALAKTATAGWKNLESSGKVLGSLGGAMSGALNIVSGISDLKSGDKLDGALNIGAGYEGAVAGVAGATEGGAGLANTAGLLSSEVAESVAAGSSVIGLTGTAVGTLAGIGVLVSQVVKGAEQVNSFDDQTVPVLNQYGITGGPETAPPASPTAHEPAADHGMGATPPPPSNPGAEHGQGA